jgi:RNA recognition motif-containing protein
MTPTVTTETHKLFVANLRYHVTSDDLMQLFARFGTITECAIIHDRENGQSRGFSFITFETAASATAALVMDGQELEGRPLLVSLARHKAARR